MVAVFVGRNNDPPGLPLREERMCLIPARMRFLMEQRGRARRQIV
jgi:hypothetical protein